MQTFNAPNSASLTGAASTHEAQPDRETIAASLRTLGEAQQAELRRLMDHARHDSALLAGIALYLDRAAEGRFLHTLQLEKAGEWLAGNAPARLQIRLMEVAKSSQHPAVQAFRTGVVRSGGFERAYPPAR